VEESVEVSVAKLELPKLAQLLEALERGPGVVKVRRVQIRTRTDDPAAVDVSLLVATYQLKS
jgi:general secretion pathway protein M